MNRHTLTFDDTLVYSTDASSPGVRPRGVTVVFFATRSPDGLDLGDQLKEHFKRVAEAEELWVVAPHSLADDLQKLAASRELDDRLRKASALATTRCITFDESGTWTLLAESRVSDLRVELAQAMVQQAGLRLLFSVTGALMTAHAGLHFGKPSGKHSTHFLRGGAVAERSVHAHFVAASLLKWACETQYDRLWVDTSAIASVAYALNQMRFALSRTLPAVVDTFGGHDGMDDVSFASPGLALISATTSGGLSKKLVERGVPLERQRTLFFVGEHDADSTVICDLTARGDDADADFIAPFKTFDDSHTCDLCNNGQNVVLLQGDSFTPVPGHASPLQLKGEYSDAAHRAFVQEFLGKRVVSLRASDNKSKPTVRSLSLHFHHLITTDPGVRKKVENRLASFLPFKSRYLIHLDDPESFAIGEIARDLCHARGLKDVELISSSELATQGALQDGVSVVIAGVTATGRELLNISRELRKLIADGGDLAYFVGCVRTSDLRTLKDLQINLTFKPDKSRYAFAHIWYAQAEPYSAANDPWLAESRILGAFEEWLREQPDNGALDAVIARRDVLANPLGAHEGFVPSNLGGSGERFELRLNPNFALWDAGLDTEEATHAEVYFTLSTVLHRSRYSADGRYSLFEQPGFGHVLAPTNFDRFNDPVIQAALLRGARGTELRFIELPPLSSRMAEVIAASVRDWADEERGGAALEFALSLIRGVREDTAGAIRLDSLGYEVVREAAKSVDESEAPVLARALQFIEASRLSG